MADDPLLAAVLANPDDDTPRLVYADWLEEHGDPARAEFIRVQCELAACQNGSPGAKVIKVRTFFARGSDHLGKSAAAGLDTPRWLTLSLRAKTLQHTHGAAWLAPLRAKGEALQSSATHGVFHRGFVELVWMPAAVFVRRWPKLFARTPARELRVTRATGGEFADLCGSFGLGRLHTLDLSDRRLGDAAGRLLAASPFAKGLRVLRLRACNLGDAGALALADAPFAWPLAELDVGLNRLGPAAVAALRRRFGDGAVLWEPPPE